MRWRGALLGMVLIAAAGLPVAMLLAPPAPTPRAWPKSPRDAPGPPPPRWDKPAVASLSLLRRVSRDEARRSRAALAACETRARRAAASRRNARYRACATAPLARTDGFAGANSRILTALAGNSGATEACANRVLRLSGTTSSLSMLARELLRGGLDAPWAELVAMSRSVRELADEVWRLARAPGWKKTCRVRRAVEVEPVA